MPNALPYHVGLGYRNVDLNHNLKAASYKYPNIKHETAFIEINRETTAANQFKFPESVIIAFNDEQNYVLSFVDLAQQLRHVHTKINDNSR